MEQVDLLIEGGIVVTVNSKQEILEQGTIVIQGDRIQALGPREELIGRFTAQRVIDASGCAVIPGLINAHTHAAMTLFRGLADDLHLMDWLEGYIFPAEAHLSADWVRWGTLLACAEMLLGGITTFCDMYLFEDEVARAAKDAGIRAVVGEVLYDFPSPNYGEIANGFRYTEELIQRWEGDDLVTIIVEPHATFTCSPELLKRARQIADDHEVLLKIHLAETKDEIERVREQYGHTPVRHLDRLGILDGPMIAAHVVWVDEKEMEILRDRGVGIVHNPESNMKLASGVSPVPRMLGLGIPVGLGTDGCASNNDLDLFREMDTAAKLHKVFGEDPTLMDASTVFNMATRMGAEVVGLGDDVGSLEAGKKADLVIVDLHQPHLVPLFNVLSHLVYSARASDVRTVVVNGQVVVEDRVLKTLDLQRIIGKVQEIAGEIRTIVSGRS
jgi:5-methylthioadenosine/S-adenosylhomocysteine deaminase